MSSDTNQDRVALEGLAWCAARGATVRFTRRGQEPQCRIEVPVPILGRVPIQEQARTFQEAYRALRDRWDERGVYPL